MYTMGLDIGSTASKGVILKDGREIVATSVIPFGTGTSGPEKVRKELMEKSALELSSPTMLPKSSTLLVNSKMPMITPKCSAIPPCAAANTP